MPWCVVPRRCNRIRLIGCAAVRVNAAEAQRLGLDEGGRVKIANSTLPLVIDATVPDGAAWIEAGHESTATLPPYGAAITLSKA